MQKSERSSIRSVIILICIALCIRGYAYFPELVESTYTTWFYPVISRLLRTSFGWLSFSMGDLLYGITIAYILWRTAQWIKKNHENKWSKTFSKSAFLKVIRIALILYIIFNILWGLNYNRTGIHGQLKFTHEKYSVKDLVEINHLLLKQVNECKETILRKNISYPSKKILFLQTSAAFSQASKKYPFLQYTHTSVKPSLFTLMGNYFGISGYYNPFTGEAQVNTDVPEFLQPYIACHEVSHQLGYAKENEANFAGFIAAISSADTCFMYAAYFDVFMYANRNLYGADSVKAKQLLTRLHPAVKDDISTLKAYYRKYENPVEPLFRWVYGKYLQANDQPLGMITYSEVVADLIAWYKQNGKLSG